MTILAVFQRPLWPLQRPARPKGILERNSIYVVLLIFCISHSSCLLRTNLIPDEDNQVNLDYLESQNSILDHDHELEDGIHHGDRHEGRCIERTVHEPKVVCAGGDNGVFQLSLVCLFLFNLDLKNCFISLPSHKLLCYKGMLVLRPTIRLLQSIKGQTCHGCIDYDTHRIHIWKNVYRLSKESNPGPNILDSSALTFQPKR